MIRHPPVPFLRLLAPVLLLTLGASAGAVEAPTYSRDIAPIFFAKCVQCHRPGQVAPMSLLSWHEARPWAKSIARAVRNRDMPPWSGESDRHHWRNDLSLSAEQIEVIVAWVEHGAPEGDPSKEIIYRGDTFNEMFVAFMEGILYLVQALTMFTITLDDIVWNGDDLVVTTQFPTPEASATTTVIEGSLDEEGRLRGSLAVGADSPQPFQLKILGLRPRGPAWKPSR